MNRNRSTVKSIEKFIYSGLRECLSIAHLLMNAGWRMKFQNVDLKVILSPIDRCFYYHILLTNEDKALKVHAP